VQKSFALAIWDYLQGQGTAVAIAEYESEAEAQKFLN